MSALILRHMCGVVAIPHSATGWLVMTQKLEDDALMNHILELTLTVPCELSELSEICSDIFSHQEEYINRYISDLIHHNLVIRRLITKWEAFAACTVSITVLLGCQMN